MKLRWEEVVIGVVSISGVIYPPTLGIGAEAEPNLLATAVLILPAAVVAGLTLRTTAPAVAGSVAGLLVLSAAWMAIAAVQAPDPLPGVVRGGWFVAMALSLFWATQQLGYMRTLRALVIAVAITIVAGVTLLSVAEVRVPDTGSLFDEPIFPWPRLRGLGANQTVIGFSGTLVFLSALVLRRDLGQRVTTLLLLIGAMGVLASHNRAAIGAIAVGIAVHAVTHRSRKSLIIASAGVTVIGLLLVFVDVGEAIVRDTSGTAVSFWSEGDPGVVTGRSEVWQSAIDHAMESPITGQGNGSFQEFTSSEYELLRARWDPTHAHSVIFEVFVDQGLVGLIVLAAVLVAAIRGWRSWPLGGALLLAAIASHSLVESVFYASPGARWQFLILVLAGVRIQAPNEERSDDDSDRDARSIGDERHVGAPT